MRFDGSVRLVAWQAKKTTYILGFKSLMSETVSLCVACQYRRVVKNARGSVFFLCEKSKTDARFAKYPIMPVIECKGYEKRS